MPDKPKGKLLYFPTTPKKGLNWGWATDNKKQTAFEIGDGRSIVSLHFRKAAAHPDTPWHLDVIEIDNGSKDELGRPVTYHMPCDEDQYDGLIKRLFACVAGTVGLMMDGDMRGAHDNYRDHLVPIIRELDVMAEIMANDHEVDYLQGTGQWQPSGWHP